MPVTLRRAGGVEAIAMPHTNPGLLGTSLSRLLLALLGAAPLGACQIIVDDRDEDAWAACYGLYEECLLDAKGDEDAVRFCGDALDACSPEGGVAPHEQPPHEPPPSPPPNSDGDGGGAEVPSEEICVSLHKTCVAEADTLAEVLACEALFDHCSEPAECPNCHDACPEAALDACLEEYGVCVGGASEEVQIEACDLLFGACVADAGADACLPEGDEALDACLAEHALCTACADGDAELAACKVVFDACVSPPM